MHMSSHPKCELCGTALNAVGDLRVHFESVHKTFNCHQCGKDIQEKDKQKHMKMHEVHSSFEKCLKDNSIVSKKKNDGKTKKKNVMNAYTMYLKMKRLSVQQRNPTMKPQEIIKILAAEWRSLSEEEKLPFKKAALDENRKNQVYDPIFAR